MGALGGERQLLFWIVVAASAMVLVGLLRDMLLPFVFGGLLAYMLNPSVDRLTALRVPRTLAAAIVLLVGIVVIGLVVVMLMPMVVDQMQKLALGLPGYIKQLRSVIEDIAQERLGSRYPEFRAGLERSLDGLTGNWGGFANAAANTAIAQMRSVMNFVSLLLITPLVAFYILADWHPMLAKIDGWLPREHAPTIRRLIGEIDDAISAFVRGQGIVCLILALFYALSLQSVGLQYGLLIGLATGIASFVPFVGWALGFIVSLILALVQVWPATGLVWMVVLVFLLGQALDAAVLSPLIVGKRIGLHPVWLLFALLAFSSLFGVLGALIAVPVAAAIGVLVRFALKAYLDSRVYKGPNAT
jgi:predicted PurR-regulated permease PerM